MTLVDTEGNPVGDGTWTTTVNFAKGANTAAIAVPKVAGYITPDPISVERTAETTELTAKAVYAAEPESFVITVNIQNAEQGEVKVSGEKIGNGFTQEMKEGETFTFTAKASDGYRLTVTGAKLKDPNVPGEYIVETNVDKTVTITFKEKEPQELTVETKDVPEILTDEEGLEYFLDADGARVEVYTDAQGGKYYLDENGAVVVLVEATQTEPSLVEMAKLVSISADAKGVLRLGDTVTLTAHNCPDGVLVYWQNSKDGINWRSIAGAEGTTYAFAVSADNSSLYWRVALEIPAE